MEKLIYVASKPPRASVEALRDALLSSAAPGVIAAGGRALRVEIADHAEDPRVPPEKLSGDGAAIAATFSFWLDTVDARAGCEDALAVLGCPLAGYLVTESIVQAYTEPSAAEGQPSPGVTQLVTFPQPAGLDDPTFFERWHDRVSPMSARLHPTRLRYERNVVARRLTEEAPPWRAIVMERWGSLEEWLDPEQLYSSMALFREMQAVGFAEPTSINLTLTSEWVFDDRSGGAAE